MNNKIILSAFYSSLILMGCSEDYTPEANADGEAIYQAACAECHSAVSEETPEMFFTIDEKNFNKNYVEFKVHNGSFMMPKFPNIKGKKMRRLGEYVLDHSLRD